MTKKALTLLLILSLLLGSFALSASAEGGKTQIASGTSMATARA